MYQHYPMPPTYRHDSMPYPYPMPPNYQRGSGIPGEVHTMNQGPPDVNGIQDAYAGTIEERKKALLARLAAGGLGRGHGGGRAGFGLGMGRGFGVARRLFDANLPPGLANPPGRGQPPMRHQGFLYPPDIMPPDEQGLVDPFVRDFGPLPDQRPPLPPIPPPWPGGGGMVPQ